MRIDIDISGVVELEQDVRAAAAQVMGKVRPSVSKGALNVKDGMRSDAAASGYFGQVAPRITYELSGNAAFAEAQIGPERGGSGSLAGIMYFGGINGGGGTVRDPQAVLDEEAPRFEKAIADIVEDLLA